jgi:hypothetical protein
MDGYNHWYIGGVVAVLFYVFAAWKTTIDASSFWTIFIGSWVSLAPDFDRFFSKKSEQMKYHRHFITHSAIIPLLFFFFAPTAYVTAYGRALFCLVYASHLWADLFPSDMSPEKIFQNLKNLDAPGCLKPHWMVRTMAYGISNKDGVALVLQALTSTILGILAIL